MKNIFHISKLIIKKKLKVLTHGESEQLRKFNEIYPFSKDVHFENLVDRISEYKTINKEHGWRAVALKSQKKQRKSVIPIYKKTWVKYAATVIVFLGIGYLYQSGYFSSDPVLVIPSENITLQLENGDIKIISEDGTTKVLDSEGNIVGVQKGNQLVYTNESIKGTLVYNTLTVPYGKRFEIQLSDGTNVHLNAGTSLKYPVKFIEGENRQVFLDGEAYFSVTKDVKHPFIVNADEINIRVLGTQFNISSYPEDDHINTVLVEGSVSVYEKDKAFNIETATILKPGFKAVWQKNGNQISIKEADIERHTAWINGKIIFRHIPFDNIIKKLERHYNVTIINNNNVLGKELVTASFDIETIEQVLKIINEIHPIDYTIKNNQIIIN